MKKKTLKKSSALVTFNFETKKIEVWGLDEAGQKWANKDAERYVYEIDCNVNMPKMMECFEPNEPQEDFAGWFIEEALKLKIHFCDIQETIR